MEMWLRLAAHGAVAYLPRTQAFYRTHGENMSVGFAGIRDLRARKAAFDSFFSEYGSHLNGCIRLYCLAHRRLAETSFWKASQQFDEGQKARCEEYLKLAVELWPPIQRSWKWIKLRAKRALGCAAWAKIRPLVRSLG